MYRILLLFILTAVLLGSCGMPASDDAETAAPIPVTVETTESITSATADEAETSPESETAEAEETSVPGSEPGPPEAEPEPTETAETETTAADTTAAPEPPSTIRFEPFVTRPIEDVTAELVEAGIGWETEERYDDDYPAGAVLSVNFKGKINDDGYFVRIGATVYLTVSLGPKPSQASAAAMTVYLTFDDGPGDYTASILDTLDAYGIKATFFTVGIFARKYPELLQDVAARGHVIGSHTNTHGYPDIYSATDVLEAEIDDWERNIQKVLGYLPDAKLFRFPGGSNTRYIENPSLNELYGVLHARGYECYDWTFADNDRYFADRPDGMSDVDYMLYSTEYTLNICLWSNTKPRIMLMHDTSEATAEALPAILDYLIAKGYTFDTLDHLEGDWLF